MTGRTGSIRPRPPSPEHQHPQDPQKLQRHRAGGRGLGHPFKDLKVKGTSETLKRGPLVKNIRLTSRPGEVECNTKKVKGLVLKTEFLKKA